MNIYDTILLVDFFQLQKLGGGGGGESIRLLPY